MRILLALGAVIAVASATGPAHAAQPPSRVMIDSRWDGMRPDAPLETKVTLLPEGDHYRVTIATSSSREKGFPATSRATTAVVERLIEALEAPPQPQVVLDQLGLDPQEVSRLIEKTIKADKSLQTTPERRARMEALIKSSQTPSAMAQVIADSLGFNIVDSNPSVHIKAEFANGRTLSASSTSGSAMMLPWKLGAAKTYSPEIAEIVSKLLPSGSVNQELLSRKFTAAGVLESSVATGLHAQMDRLRVENEAPVALHALATRFEVIDPSFLAPFKGDGPQLQTELRSRSGPRNLVMFARLRLDGGHLLDQEKTMKYLVEQFRVVNAAKTLSDRIRASPSREFRMVYRIGFPPGWLNAEISAEFVHDMQALHKLPELKTNPALMKGAALVTEGLAFWIALPDHRTVLWKKSYDDTPASHETMRCGRILDSEGKVYLDKPDLCIGKIFAANVDVKP